MFLPVDIENAGDGRLFIVEQEGFVRILHPDGSKSLFLDIESRVDFGGEQGLLGLAFSPNYPTDGFFYLNYTNNSGDTRISRFSVTADPDLADDASEEV